jgi:hypothetical protein
MDKAVPAQKRLVFREKIFLKIGSLISYGFYSL